MVELKQSIRLTINGQDIELTTADARELYALLGAAIGNAPAPTPVHAPLKTPYPGWFEFPLNPTCHTGYRVEPTAMVSSYGYKPKNDTLSSFLCKPTTPEPRACVPGYFLEEDADYGWILRPELPEFVEGKPQLAPIPDGWRQLDPVNYLSPLVRI